MRDEDRPRDIERQRPSLEHALFVLLGVGLALAVVVDLYLSAMG
ncbi:MAG: hypothetical protein ACLFMX_07335 [Halobacteriales archaeon]